MRIVATRGAGEPKRYETVSFDEFAQWRCYSVATDRVQEEIEARYNGLNGYDVSANGEHGVSVSALIDPRTHPDYFHLLHAFPEHVEVTLQYTGGTATCSVPVHVGGQWSRPVAV